jgi:hypothetical protein
MRRTSIGRLLGALGLAASFVLTVSGTASASPPNWSMTVVDLPSLAANGSGVGYRVTIHNGGPSNISSLYLVTKTQNSPAFVDSPSQGTCSSPGAGALSCNFGALTNGSSVSVVVGYAAPASGTSFDPVFQGNTTGATFSDAGHSHGDTLQDPNETPTQLTTSRDFAGGFALNQNKVSTDANLGKNNVQSTSVTPPEVGLVATVQDGAGVGTFTCSVCTKTLFGEWSKVTVGHGESFGIPFPVTLLVLGKTLPKGVTADSIELVHVLDNGTTQILPNCGTGELTTSCVTVTPVGSNYRITGLFDQNGRFKGMG